jgi:hypothetical protein
VTFSRDIVPLLEHRPPREEALPVEVPVVDVRWGERTIDEMGHAAILYTFDDEAAPASR